RARPRGRPARAAHARARRGARGPAPDGVAGRRGAAAGSGRLPRRAGAVAERLRAAAPADARLIAELIARCDATYADWAPDGWSPPPPPERQVRRRLEDRSAWTRVAGAGDELLVGVVSWRPDS